MIRNVLIILRGIPGSGKSTKANEIKNCADFLFDTETTETHIYSTDDYFIDESGEYAFVPSLISKAHKWNQDRVRKALLCEYNVIVDNTNIKQWEVGTYRKIGKYCGVSLIKEYIVCESLLRKAQESASAFNLFHTLCYERGIHNVPQEVLERMIKDFEW